MTEKPTYLDHNNPYDMALLKALLEKGFKEEDVEDLVDSGRVTMENRGEFYLDGEELVTVFFPTNC